MAALTLFCTIFLTGFVEGFFVVTPRDTLVRLGDTTQLNCTFMTVVSDNCAWYKGRGANREAVTWGRGQVFEEGDFEIIDSKDDREYNLHLFNVIRENEDIYECGSTLTGQRSSAHVYVIDTLPNCTVSGTTTAVAGEERTFECKISMHAHAPGELVWIKGNSEMDRQEGHVNKWTTRLSRFDNNVIFDCQLQHVTIPSWKWRDISCTEKVTINVQYGPEASIVVTSRDPLIEGNTFTARCTNKDSNPTKIDDVYWKDPFGSTVASIQDLILKNVTRKQSGVYTCVMRNTFYNGVRENGTAFVEIDVHYSPNLTFIETTIEAEKGDVIELYCSADGYPTPIIKWFGGDSYIIQGIDATRDIATIVVEQRITSYLTVTVADDSYYGTYSCQALNGIQPNVTKAMQIVRKSNTEYGFQESSDVSVTPAVVIPLVAIVAIILGVIFYCKRMKKTQTHSAKIVYVKNSDESSSRPEEGALGDHDVVMPSVIMNKYEQHNNGKSNSTDSEGIYEEPIDRLYNTVDEVQHCAPLSVHGKADATYSHPRRSDNIDVSREFLSFREVLHEGDFGKVVIAEAWNIAGRDGNSVVAVKILKDNASIADKQHFLNELVAMKSVGAHQNVIALLGCCRDSDPYCIILEYMARGNLKNYLWTCNLERATNANYENGNWMLRSSSLLNYAHQIAMGMAYISSKQCIHQDLSARNVLLNDHDVCKISGFGLSSNVMNERQYKRRTQGRLPIRWMAVEVMDACAFTTNSDVWSFGVVIWEIANLGNKPYAGMSNKEVMSSVQEGYRMPKPPQCDKELYAIMLSCWNADPKKRPCFTELTAKLEKLKCDGKIHIDLDAIEPIDTSALQSVEEESI